MSKYIIQLEQDTSIMTMSHETIGQMNRYEEAVRHAAGLCDVGLITYDEALGYVRNNG